MEMTRKWLLMQKAKIPWLCYCAIYSKISLNCSWQQHGSLWLVVCHQHGLHLFLQEEGDLCASDRRHPPARWHFPKAVPFQLLPGPPSPLETFKWESWGCYKWHALTDTHLWLRLEGEKEKHQILRNGLGRNVTKISTLYCRAFFFFSPMLLFKKQL